MPTFAGMSGSPLYIKVGNARGVIGVHTGIYPNNTDLKTATAFTKSNFEWILKSLNELK